jgi:thiol:disulfide interchange protein DsbD
VYAKEVNKPILLDFTGIFCTNCKKMKASAFKDPRVIETINAGYVFAALYTDVKTATLAPEDQIVSHNGRAIRTIGDLNAEYQLQKFDVRSQPYFAVIDSNENILIKGLGYAGADELLDFLTRGLAAFHK